MHITQNLTLNVEKYKLSFQLLHLSSLLEVRVFADHSLKTTAVGNTRSSLHDTYTKSLQIFIHYN
jgi:hypothetical protein